MKGRSLSRGVYLSCELPTVQLPISGHIARLKNCDPRSSRSGVHSFRLTATILEAVRLPVAMASNPEIAALE